MINQIEDVPFLSTENDPVYSLDVKYDGEYRQHVVQTKMFQNTEKDNSAQTTKHYIQKTAIRDDQLNEHDEDILLLWGKHTQKSSHDSYARVPKGENYDCSKRIVQVCNFHFC